MHRRGVEGAKGRLGHSGRRRGRKRTGIGVDGQGGWYAGNLLGAASEIGLGQAQAPTNPAEAVHSRAEVGGEVLVGKRTAEQQVIAGAGASHVQQALLFGVLAATCVAVDEGADIGLDRFVILLGVARTQADALFRVEEDRVAASQVKSRGQVGDYDDGKLQALGRMYG